MCHKCHKYFVVEMEVGISKKTIVWFLLSQQTLAKKKFIGVFPSNFVNRFISFHKIISKSDAKYISLL